METRRVPPEHHADRDFELGVAGFRYPELHKPERLKLLHERFLEELEQAEPVLAGQFAAYRAAPPAGLAPPAESELLIQVARHVARFVARLFHIEARHGAQQAAAAQEAVLFRFKKDFVKWRSAKRKDPAWDETTFREREAALSSRGYELGDELAFARKVMAAVDREAALRTAGEEVERARLVEELEAVDAYLAQRLGRHDERGWTSLHLPEALDYGALVKLRRPEPKLPTLLVGPKRRRRDGFKLSDPRMPPRETTSDVNYCSYCHD